MARPTRLPEALYDYHVVPLARQAPHAGTRERLLGMAHWQQHGSLTRMAEALWIYMTKGQNWLNGLRRELLSNRVYGLGHAPVRLFRYLFIILALNVVDH